MITEQEYLFVKCLFVYLCECVSFLSLFTNKSFPVEVLKDLVVGPSWDLEQNHTPAPSSYASPNPSSATSKKPPFLLPFLQPMASSWVNLPGPARHGRVATVNSTRDNSPQPACRGTKFYTVK